MNMFVSTQMRCENGVNEAVFSLSFSYLRRWYTITYVNEEKRAGTLIVDCQNFPKA